MSGLDQHDYERLLAFRTGLRRFLSWSGQQAEAAGITPAQHQLLLAIRGHPDPRGPTIGEIAGYLLVRHHSAVELIDRAVAAGLVTRQADNEDGRTVRRPGRQGDSRWPERSPACGQRCGESCWRSSSAPSS